MSLVTVSEWRIYCLTENAWIESWSINAPSTCAHDTSHSVNTSSVQILQNISNQMVEVMNEYKDALESSRVVEQSPIIDLKSFHGITSKNKTNTTATGTVTATSEVTSEIKLSISATTDVAGIRSAKRGYYIAGLVSETGIAIRIPTALTSTNVLKWGYFDDQNGYYFKLVGTQLNACILHSGTETLIEYADFNTNRLDGSESNGITLDFSKGNIFRIQFTWYGFGQVVFGVIQTNIENEQKFYPMHIYDNTNTGTTCGNPYLPINIQLSSNGSTLTRDVYVAGRQYSILGKLIDNNLRNMYFINNASSSDTNTNPLFSLRYNTSYITCPTEIKKIRAIANVNIVLQIVKNATLTGSSFSNNNLVDASCLQVDTSATFTGGTVFKTYLLFANTPIDIEVSDCDIYETDTITFTWKSTVSSNTISIQVDYEEKW
jgi:hypothetical protein